MLQGYDDVRQAKVLNLDASIAFPSERLAQYLAAKERFLDQFATSLTLKEGFTELNVTPAFSTVHVHHDEDIVISTVRTIKDLAARDSDPPIAKIWIIWPPDHIHALSLRGPRSSYGDTAHSLSNAGGAMWFAQRDGETVVVPSDLAHATFTLRSCYLIASSYQAESPTRVSLIPTDIAAGTGERVACMRLVKRVKEALARPFDQSLHFMASFWCESAHNIPILRRNKVAWHSLLRSLAEHMQNHRQCISCVVLKMGQDTPEAGDSLRHVELHAGNEIHSRSPPRRGKAHAGAKIKQRSKRSSS